MKNCVVSSVETAALKVLWRNYTCYHLNAPFISPENPAIQCALTERIRAALDVDSITPVFKSFGDGAWLCTFFHQAPRNHHATTYENGQPGHVSYCPRCAATFIFDPNHHILYLSVGEKEPIEPLLRALTGILIPEEADHPLPTPYLFDLSGVPYLGNAFRRPDIGAAAWTVLKLKNATTVLPGEESNTQEYRSTTDLLDNPAFFTEHHYESFQTMTFAVHIPFRKRPHTLQIFNRTACIRATITAETLDSIAALTALLDTEANLKETPSCDPSQDLF